MQTLAADLHAAPPAERRHNLLWMRIGLLLIVVIASMLVLVSYLNYSNYRKAYLDLNLTRYMIVAKDVRQTVLGGLNVGLTPAENVPLLPAIRAQLGRENGIRFIGVLDESGAVIGAGRIDPGGAARWRNKLAETAPTASWQRFEAGVIEIGIPFVNNYNVKAGAVVIGYDRRPIERAASHMLRMLAADMAISLVVLALLTFTGVYFLTHKFFTVLAGVAATIDASGGAGGGAKPLSVEGDYLGAGVAQEINAFTEASHRLAGELAVLEHEVAAARPDGAHGEPT